MLFDYFIMFSAVIVAVLFGIWLGKFLRREKYKQYLKYHGFIFGFVFSYLFVFAIYYLVFEGDFSYWYYITPFNVLIFSVTIFVGYCGYYDVTKKLIRIKGFSINGFLLFFVTIIGYGIICHWIEILFGWNLHFLFFPWQH